MEYVDRNKTLEELEGAIWPHDDFGSHVVLESQRLRKIPIRDLSVENLRLLIGQKIGLEFLVPLAIECLMDSPLVSGDYYRGDLMVAVLAIPEEFWTAHPVLNNQVVEIGFEVVNLYDTITEQILPAIKRFQFRNE